MSKIYLVRETPFGKTVYRPSVRCGVRERKIYESLCWLCGQRSLTDKQIETCERLGFQFEIEGYERVGGYGNGSLLCKYAIHNNLGEIVALDSVNLSRDFFDRADWADELLNRIRRLPVGCDACVPRDWAEYSKNGSGIIAFPTFKIAFTTQKGEENDK